MHLMLILLGAVQGVAARDSLQISLEDATRRALAVSPSVLTALGAVHLPRGLRAEAWWPFPENPTVEYAQTRRRTAVTTLHDREWTATQDIEIAGQWVLRGRAASALVSSSEARVEDARRLSALDVRRVYVTLTIAERRATLTDTAAAFAEQLAEFARRQFAAGETNRLELNAVVLEAARTRSAAQRARAGEEAAAADLARLLALPQDSTPRTTPLSEVPPLALPSDTTLLRIAREHRPDLKASDALRRSTERTATLARLSLVPDLTVSAFGGHTEGDDVLGVALGFRVPLFHRQQGATGAADADRAAARAEEAATERAVLADVEAASTRFARARQAEQLFAGEVLRAASENVALTERALTEGEVSVTDVLVLRRTAADAQLEYLDVLDDAYSAWFELAAALAAEPQDLAALLGTTK